MEQISVEQIRRTMKEIGDKFAKQTLEATSTKAALNSFSIAERAYNFVFKFENGTDYGGLVMQFLDGLEGQIKRSLAYIRYCEFCGENEVKPLQKSEFFRRVKLLDYDIRPKGGDYFIMPPGVKKRRRNLRTEAKQLIHDASFSSVSPGDEETE